MINYAFFEKIFSTFHFLPATFFEKFQLFRQFSNSLNLLKTDIFQFRVKFVKVFVQRHWEVSLHFGVRYWIFTIFLTATFSFFCEFVYLCTISEFDFIKNVIVFLTSNGGNIKSRVLLASIRTRRGKLKVHKKGKLSSPNDSLI